MATTPPLPRDPETPPETRVGSWQRALTRAVVGPIVATLVALVVGCTALAVATTLVDGDGAEAVFGSFRIMFGFGLLFSAPCALVGIAVWWLVERSGPLSVKHAVIAGAVAGAFPAAIFPVFMFGSIPAGALGAYAARAILNATVPPRPVAAGPMPTH